ncbi:MAG: hypothetical protein PUE08_05870 [Eubacteriales bacterium]|nr:hypothetical protein [Eubacteriales bacterium]
MNHDEKRLIKYSALIPVIVAVVLSAVFCAVLANIDFPFTDRTVSLADYQKEEIKEPSEFQGDFGETIKRGDIAGCVSDNTIIGDISIENTSFPVIYNANEVNACGKLNIVNDAFIGETRRSFAEIYKNDSSMLKMLAKGDTVTVTTFYSVYDYEVVDTMTVSNYSQLKRCGEGIGNAVVLFTDNSVGPGISNEYFVCVCKMISGSKVTEG